MRGEMHYTLTRIEGVCEAIKAAHDGDLSARFNISPGQRAPVAIVREGARVIEHMRWGLLPRWRGHGGKRGPLVHAAPLEAVGGTPLLRDAFKNQRCLVIADGCYAWRELKQPVWFHPQPPRTIAFAGVWNVNDDDDVASFAILMGPPLVTRVNDAMPIVIEPESYAAWLDPSVAPDQATELLMGTPLSGWRADTVSTRMSSSAHDDEQCIAPLGNPNQGELF
jgi:putative SOS response-associated peptidase YedK